ncbi:MAG TPA: hypothetical protein VHE61_24300 [Opitutaceae bacterium]|nr:hypothetical protein [Opitutaceae bacterium]
MSASTDAPVRPTRIAWPLVALITAVYVFAHLLWYLGTPLGRVPVLDEREELSFAHAIVTGTLPAEPFYRAPGYALFLAVLQVGGVPGRAVFPAALIAGALLHVVNAVLLALVAARWFDRRAGFAAGLLYGLNPVFIHFAVRASDATPALTAFLAGLVVLAPELDAPAPLRTRRWLAASLAWAVATILRPNYFLPWLLLPALAWWVLRQAEPPSSDAGASRRRPPVVAAACGGLVCFALIAIWQYRVCGTPGFLPSQGPYNLWAANAPGANGRYYVQRLSLPAALAVQNPARVESLLLYEQATGRRNATLAQANPYWRGRFVAYVTRHPLDWLRLLGSKLYALLNDWEQYNNETPAFHIARSPWLRWNPLSWGVLFVLGLAGVGRLAIERPRTALAAGWIAAAVALSALLFFVSARFRLPLAALAAVLAGGGLAAPLFWVGRPRRQRFTVAAACALAAFVAFSRFGAVHDPATFVQDHTLLARAAETVGDDATAWTEAEAALALRPDHPDALRLAVSSYFNLLLADAAPPGAEPAWRSAAERLLASGATDLRPIAALALWRAGETPRALAEWRGLGAAPSAVAARLLAGDPSLDRAALAAIASRGADEPLVRLAAAVFDVPLAHPLTADAARPIVARLFPRHP